MTQEDIHRTVSHRPKRRWTTLWLVVGCACGYLRWRGSRCPIDETAERIGDGDTVPLPAFPAVALIDQKTRPLPVVPYRRRLLTMGGEWRANGGRQ